jgi:hypothetical protein
MYLFKSQIELSHVIMRLWSCHSVLDLPIGRLGCGLGPEGFEGPKWMEKVVF